MDNGAQVSLGTLVPRPERGAIQRQARAFGRSASGLPLHYWAADWLSGQPTLVLAAIHGDEPDTTVVLSEALRSVPAGALAADVVLAANPDGLLRGTRGNSSGVDLNRNFPTTDWSGDDAVYRWGPDTPRDVKLSSGRGPASEPEVRALMALIDERRPAVIVALHAPLGCIDDANCSNLGRWLAHMTGLPLVRDVGYPTPGSLGTWARERAEALVTYEFGHEPLAVQSKVHLPVLVDLLLGAAAVEPTRQIGP